MLFAAYIMAGALARCSARVLQQLSVIFRSAWWLRNVFVATVLLQLTCNLTWSAPQHGAQRSDSPPVVEANIQILMRDGITLFADVYKPSASGRFPVLVYRTPYGKHHAAKQYGTHIAAVKRGYVVVLQDVRGRYASEGVFTPYRHEGRDGYDTIEWAARQSWSNGRVGTYGLSYPGAVQWLAAMEAPPHLVAMAPAMTFSSPRNFFYSNGVFDLSWLSWIYVNIAPDSRRRLKLPGIQSPAEAQKSWEAVAEEYRSWLPLTDLPYLRREAPYYFDWLQHPPEDGWWDWAELRDRYSQVSAAVLNLTGWHEDAYGVEGAITNFSGLLQARASGVKARTNLVIGPWAHGVDSVSMRQTGDIDFGSAAAIDYDDLVLDFMDHHLRGVRNEFSTAAPVRHFVMGANEWRAEPFWPPPDAAQTSLYLAASSGGAQKLLQQTAPGKAHPVSSFVANPRTPVRDPYDAQGPHDYRQLVSRSDVLTFDSEPLSSDWLVIGAVIAEMYVSCDCRDFDLWVRLQDVYPDGRAFNLMSPGNDVLRASYRDPPAGRQLLQPGRPYLLRLSTLHTSNLFRRGHRIRVQVSASFAPHLSRNLQTGESEVSSSLAKRARITIHHDARLPSRLLVPLVRESAQAATESHAGLFLSSVSHAAVCRSP